MKYFIPLVVLINLVSLSSGGYLSVYWCCNGGASLWRATCEAYGTGPTSCQFASNFGLGGCVLGYSADNNTSIFILIRYSNRDPCGTTYIDSMYYDAASSTITYYNSALDATFCTLEGPGEYTCPNIGRVQVVHGVMSQCINSVNATKINP